MNPLCAGLLSVLLFGGCPKPVDEMGYAERLQLQRQLFERCRPLVRTQKEMDQCIAVEAQRENNARHTNREQSEALVRGLGALGGAMLNADAIQRRDSQPTTTQCFESNWGTMTCTTR